MNGLILGIPFRNALVILAMTSALLLLIVGACTTEEETDRGTVPGIVTDDPATLETTPDPTSESRRSILAGQTPTPTLGPAATSAPVPTPTPGIVKPPGYHHGIDHGLALTQIARQPSQNREGWVDIVLNLAAVRFAGGELSVNSSTSTVLCFETSREDSDCLNVKWGSTEQNEADLSLTQIESAEEHHGSKAVNFQATFQVAGNATNATLYFNEQRIPLDLQGDHVLTEYIGPPLPAPTSPSTGSYFLASAHGIAVTTTDREPVDRGRYFHSEFTSLVTVGLSVLSIDGFDPTQSETLVDLSAGSLCLNNGESECLEIFWGPENQFNAILSVEDAYLNAFRGAVHAGGRLPAAMEVQFKAPNKYENAILKFGSHEIPLDLRGIQDTPSLDYTALYSEAVTGAALYDSDGKTVTLDRVRHDPASGGVELQMTASNDSEALDFTPAFLTDAIFSSTGIVDLTPGQRDFTVDRLAPGQSAAFNVVIPRSGNAWWGYVPYSELSEERPDAVAFQIVDLLSEPVSASSSGAAPTPIPIPTPVPGGAQDADADAPPAGLKIAPYSARLKRDSRASDPVFVKFDRTGDEERFWPFKFVWRHQAHALPSVTDDAVLSLTTPYNEIGTIFAIEPRSGRYLWQREYNLELDYRYAVGNDTAYSVFNYNDLLGRYILNLDPMTGATLSKILIEDDIPVNTDVEKLDATVPGKICFGARRYETFGYVCYDPVSGELLWRGHFLIHEPFNVANGVVYGSGESVPQPHMDYVLGVDFSTGEEVLKILSGEYADVATLSDGKVYWGRVQGGSWNRPILIASDATTGEEIWGIYLSREESRKSPNVCCISVSGDVLLVGHNIGFAAVYKETGEFKWSLEDLDERSYEYVGVWSSAHEGERIFVATSKGARALDSETGETLWVYDGETYFRHVSYKGGVVYAVPGEYADSEGSIVAIDAATGEKLWRFDKSGTGVPVIDGDMLYWLSTDGYLYGIRIE